MEENFFENEFLEYLNKNTNGNYKIFDESKSEYTFFENELIRSISDMVKDLVNKMSEGCVLCRKRISKCILLRYK